MVKNSFNTDLSETFELTADLLELHGENPFKIKSYRTAAYRIEKTEQAIDQLSEEEIEQIDGIGKSLAKKILEYYHKGSITELDELKSKTPDGVIELFQIKGIGPKKISVLWKDLGIESIAELYYACNENRLITLKGFGEKTQELIKKNIAFSLSNNGKFHFAVLENEANEVLNKLKEEGITNISCTGAIRRKCETGTTIELISTKGNKSKILSVLHEYPADAISAIKSTDNKIECKLKSQIPLEIYLSDKEEYFWDLFVTTGSSAHLEQLQVKPFKAASEEEIYASKKLPFIHPEMREGLGEIELAKGGKLPELLEFEDLKGILHNHSTYSDGLHTLEKMANYCKELGYEYLGICDHSKSAFYANGMKEETIRKQHQEIDHLNKTLSPFKILKGIESDILNDGSLDYEDAVLETFDFVVASIHSNLRMSEEKANARLIRAIENPYTSILGHPTGRLLLAREGYPIDHKKIIDACAANHVVIELNAHPFRLDIDWRWIHYAMEKHVFISINPDAHQISGYHDMYYGVCAARKGGLTKRFTFNALSLKEITTYFSGLRKIKNLKTS